MARILRPLTEQGIRWTAATYPALSFCSECRHEFMAGERPVVTGGSGGTPTRRYCESCGERHNMLPDEEMV